MRQSAYRIGAPVVESVVISIAAGDRVTPTPRHIRGVGRRGPRTEKAIPAAIARRAVFAGSLLALPAFADDASPALADLERRNGGRLGVAALDTASGRQAGWRSDERFPICSTFKFLAAALVLARVDRSDERLDRRIVFSAKDLVTYSPVTQDHVGPGGMSVAEICEAAVTLSDNTAGNLMLASFGGPAALTAYVRTLGDGLTRLDRIETALNEAAPGDPRDTTTPNAMLGDMRRLLVGDARRPTRASTSRTGCSPARRGRNGCAPACRPIGGWATRRARVATERPTTLRSPGRRVVRRFWSPSTSPARRSPTTRAAR